MTLDLVSGDDLTTPVTALHADLGASTPMRGEYALRIGYACGAASPCDDVTIDIAPQQFDDFYGTHQFAKYLSSTLPAGASISGNDATGYTVSLGTVPAGASGSFPVVYSWQDRRARVSDQSFFLDGTTITNTVTIDGANAGATATDDASLTWGIDTPEPEVNFATQNLARSGVEYTYTLQMGSGCMDERGTGDRGEPGLLCASQYVNTFELPPGTSFVGASPDGTYDPVSNSVIWDVSGEDAATGWNSARLFGQNRTVTVVYDDSGFTDSCVRDSTANFRTDVTYLDGTTGSDATSVTHEVTNCAPFGAVSQLEKWSSKDADPNLVYADGGVEWWYLRVANMGNVPGQAIIEDLDLDIPNTRVFRAVAPDGGTIDYTLDDGTTGTAVGDYIAPTGRRIVGVTFTSPLLDGPNKESASEGRTTYWRPTLRYTVEGEPPAEGWPLVNEASATMTYPDYDIDPIETNDVTGEALAVKSPANIRAAISRTLPPTGNPTAGVPVTYELRGFTSLMDDDSEYRPQYVFVAPESWELVDESWSLATGAPADVTYTVKTVTIDGVEREALYVHWPEGTAWGANSDLPTLTVQATPTATAPAGSVGTADGFIGDGSNSYLGHDATWGWNNNAQRFTDAPDLDGDGVTDEYFAGVSADATVGAASALVTLKEVCVPDDEAADGCAWTADTSDPALIPYDATQIRYRVTITNAGNTPLAGIVGYDILPHVGDTGVSQGSASTPRGSEFSQTLASLTADAGLEMTYSASTNPCRPEVYPGGPSGCDDTWAADPAGQVSIRAAVTAPLAAGASTTFTYAASVGADASEGEAACNSIAAAATGVPVSEPAAVCATIDVGPRTLTWEKVAAGTAEPLAGSEWELQPVDSDDEPVGEPMTVVDCDVEPCEGADTDATPGVITVGDLVDGRYRLTETRAPAGYLLLDEPLFIEVAGDTVLPDPIENEQAVGPVLPFTGGMASDAFSIGAITLMALAGVFYVVRSRRRTEGPVS